MCYSARSASPAESAAYNARQEQAVNEFMAHWARAQQYIENVYDNVDVDTPRPKPEQPEPTGDAKSDRSTSTDNTKADPSVSADTAKSDRSEPASASGKKSAFCSDDPKCRTLPAPPGKPKGAQAPFKSARWSLGYYRMHGTLKDRKVHLGYEIW